MLLLFYKVLSFITIVITASMTFAVDNQNTLQTQSLHCTPSLSQSNNPTHTRKIRLFAAIVNNDYRTTTEIFNEAEILNLNKELANTQFIIYKEEKTNAIQKIILNNLQEKHPNTVLVPNADTSLDNLFRLYGHTSFINVTALHVAVAIGNPFIIDLLLKHFAMTNVTSHHLTAFDLLAYQEHLDTTNRQSIVISFINNPFTDDKIIAGAYHHAALNRNVPVAATLIKYAKESIPNEMINP